MKYSSLIIISILFLSGSCNNRPDRNYLLLSIDSLNRSLEETASLIESIDTIALNQYVGIVNKRITDLKSDDNNNNHKIVVSYEIVLSGMLQCLEGKNELQTELEYTKLQLSNLKTDLENDLLNSVLATTYIEQEKKSANVLNLKTNYFTSLNHSSQTSFKKLEEKFEPVIE